MSSKKIIFSLCIYKMYLISAKGYENAGAHFLRIRKTGKICRSMKNVQDTLGVKNMSDLIKHLLIIVKRNIYHL